MKNYNEIAESVFSRRDKAVAEKARRRKTARNTVLPVICLCAVIGAVIGFGHEWEPTHAAPTSEQNKTQNKIVINTELPESIGNNGIMDFYLDVNDFVPMTKDELRAFYGTEIFPWTPPDLSEYLGHYSFGESERYGIFRANGGTGDITHDNLLILFTNREAEKSRALEIEVSKKYRYLSVNNWGSIQSHDTLTKAYPCSIINGTEVFIYQNLRAGGGYSAVFIYNDTGFSISADGFSEDELIRVIESLTECGNKFKGNEYNPHPVLPMIQDFEGDALADTTPENGEIIMSPALLNAMEHHGDKAKYLVAVTVCKSGKALGTNSDEVMAERERFSELGYIVYYTEHTTPTPNVYRYVFGFHATYEELKNLPSNSEYGYIIKLCNE